ncbi:hypothetical protein [Xanthobacter flavus]|uniref:hypothetical protein n=1 Tax=Xanthobacter flavus TaxID=281 RepID=UPI0037273058
MDDDLDFRDVSWEKGPTLLRTHQIHQPALGDIALFDAVRTKPIDDRDILASVVQGRSDVRFDEPPHNRPVL